MLLKFPLLLEKSRFQVHQLRVCARVEERGAEHAVEEQLGALRIRGQAGMDTQITFSKLGRASDPLTAAGPTRSALLPLPRPDSFSPAVSIL